MEIGLMIFLGVVCLMTAVWLYIDNLKYELRNMTFDRDMYARLYELYKPQPKNDK